MNNTPPTRPRSIRWTALIALAAAGVAGLAAPASAQSDDPFEAQVVENEVMVRSGAGRAYYEVGKLQRGDRVVVADELFGWYKIECPAGVFCFVDRKNVDAKGDGSRGVVNTDATPINAAHATKGPADSYRKLDDLSAGDVVQIVANVDNAYKILPPEGTYVFLPPNSIEIVGDEPDAPEAPETPVAPTTETPTTPEPAQPTTPDVVEVPAPPVVVAPVVPEPEPAVTEVPPTPEPPAAAEARDPIVPEPEMPAVTEVTFEDPTPADTAAPKVDLLNDPDVKVALPEVGVTTQASNELLRAVEVAILPYFTLPVDEQPIAKMVRGYADAAQIEGLSDNDLTIIRTRLTELERNRTLAEAMHDIEDTHVEVNDGQPPEAPTAVAIGGSADDGTGESTPDVPAAPDAPDAGTETAAAPAPEAPDAPAAPPVFSSEYDAVGVLTASTVHTGGNQPELFRLLDPTGRRTVAYLEPGDPIDTVQMIGRLVGIVGDSVYDPSTKLNLIQPERIDILNAR